MFHRSIKFLVVSFFSVLLLSLCCSGGASSSAVVDTSASESADASASASASSSASAIATASPAPVSFASLPAGSTTFTSLGADGWATTTTGGNAAAAANIYTVTTRAEFVAALKCGGSSYSTTAKIINVSGMIDLCVNTSNVSLGAYDFITLAGYSGTYASYAAFQDAYIATCTSALDGNGTPETVRAAAASKQAAIMVITIPANTTIIGVGSSSGFKNGSLSISGTTAKNIVIRNVSILDAYDYFPAWDASDGNINSEYDNISIVSGATYVWVDHCTLGDGDRPDSTLPYFTISGVSAKKEWVTHDGVLDVTKTSNYVTISYNKILNHNKTMLFGSDASYTADSGKLKITVHHNYFDNAVQRLPRVRYGQVHIYNNFYASVGLYSIGKGACAKIYSENNYFYTVGTSINLPETAAKYATYGAGYLYDTGSVNVNSTYVDTLASIGWTPSSVYTYTADAAADVPSICNAYAGAGTSIRP